jgi:hypothetical protein
MSRLDPARQHQAAAIAGRLAAAGQVDGPEVLAAIVAAARQAAPRTDPAGLATRLAHRFHDARIEAGRARERARARIAWAIAPLLDRRAPGEALLEAADEADPEAALAPAERRAIIEQAILRTLARRAGR